MTSQDDSTLRNAPRPTLAQLRDAAADEMARSGFSPEVIDAALYVPRPTLAASDSLSLCRSCGEDYYPEDIPADLADVGRYGTCADCRAELVADLAVWAVAS